VPPVDNLFANIPSPTEGEVFETLLQCRAIKIERIVSSDAPEPILYDQPGDEWVLLLSGQARLELEGTVLELKAGDYLFIPARTPHRVIFTSSDPRCTWLAVHLNAEPLP
jgi:cupin 2 domain-containing protein